MENGWFDVPVSVKDRSGARNVTSARQAAEFLLRGWPADWTDGHRAARVACLAVLKGYKAPAYARRAFASAARDADLLTEESDVNKDIRMAETQERAFDRPVTVSDPVGKIEIGSAREVRDYLQNVEWPSSASQEEALATAQAALDGVLSASDARDRFIDAARQAGVLVFD